MSHEIERASVPRDRRITLISSLCEDLDANDAVIVVASWIDP